MFLVQQILYIFKLKIVNLYKKVTIKLCGIKQFLCHRAKINDGVHFIGEKGETIEKCVPYEPVSRC